MDQTEIVNVALSYLGQKSISIIDEDTPTAIRCLSMWSASWEGFLESHDWKFARKVAAPALVGTEPTIDWAYAYTVPSDCIVPRVIVPSAMPFTLRKANNAQPFDVVGTRIHTDCEEPYLLYTHRVIDHRLAPPSAVKAFACQFAIDLAVGMTGAKTISKIRDQLKEDLQLLMVEAIRQNDVLGYLEPIDKTYPTLNPYLAARQ